MLSAQTVAYIHIDGSINPAVADYVSEGIDKAHEEHAACLVVGLNTPGGLLESTRVIVSSILKSPVPVVVYVSPGGAHAGSAGVFLVMAAHIAAMAPGTNIGAAHPVGLGQEPDSVMNAKGVNDAAAFIRSIADRRNRNVEWAENAVRYSVSITAKEALQNKVIDLIAGTDQDLLNQLDGKRVDLEAGTVTLHTKGARIVSLDMSFVERLLNILGDPNISYIIMLLGIYGVLFELFSPGSILPGIVGVIALVMAFYSMHVLPINYAGLALIVFSIILFLLELKVASHGLLAIGGIVSLVLGSMMLFRSDSSLEMVRVSRVVIISATLVSALFFLFVIGMALRAQRRKPASGVEAMIGEKAVALGPIDLTGTVKLQGEIWNAESLSGRINKGETVLVREIRNLILYVERNTNA